MFSSTLNILAANPSKRSALSAIAPKRFSKLLSIACVSSLFADRKSKSEWRVRNLDRYVVSFYDAGLELLETKVVIAGGSINLNDKKSEYGVEGWHLIKSAIALGENYTPSGSTNFYAEPNVIEISNQTELNAIRDNPSGSYVLTRDIKLEAKGDGFDETWGWEPIGDDTKPFGGIFNGNSHKISNLWVNKTSGDDYAGLFGCIEGGTIKNLELLINESKGVRGESYVGGIAGKIGFGSVISNSYSIGNVSGTYEAGGIAGRVGFDSQIINSFCAGSVSGTCNIGGIAGYVMSGSKITNAYSKATVNGDSDVGGIAGYVYGDSVISNSYSTGNVNGTNNVGGIAGSVEYSSKVANNAAINQKVVGRYDINRIVGKLNGSIASNNFALNVMKIEAEGDEGSDGTPKADLYFKTQTTYSNAPTFGLGWSFGESDSSPWKKDEGYPYLYWEER
ncbi:MAG: hypothetical protein LBQ18_08035 [Campylobacteraceae bacterium]|jgi:hypothetical protein|nr:hypothetical protein [Campylobacteraceae bacterium]